MIKVIKTKPTTMRTSQYQLEFGEHITAFETATMNHAFHLFCDAQAIDQNVKITKALKTRFHSSRYYKDALTKVNAAKYVAVEPIIIATLKAIPVMNFDVSNEMGHPDDLKRFKAVIEAVRKA